MGQDGWGGGGGGGRGDSEFWEVPKNGHECFEVKTWYYAGVQIQLSCQNNKSSGQHCELYSSLECLQTLVMLVVIAMLRVASAYLQSSHHTHYLIMSMMLVKFGTRDACDACALVLQHNSSSSSSSSNNNSLTSQASQAVRVGTMDSTVNITSAALLRR